MLCLHLTLAKKRIDILTNGLIIAIKSENANWGTVIETNICGDEIEERMIPFARDLYSAITGTCTGLNRITATYTMQDGCNMLEYHNTWTPAMYGYCHRQDDVRNYQKVEGQTVEYTGILDFFDELTDTGVYYDSEEYLMQFQEEDCDYIDDLRCDEIANENTRILIASLQFLAALIRSELKQYMPE